MKHALVVVAVVIGVLAGVIAFASGDLMAGMFFGVMWAFALSFIEPRRAWLWWLLMAAWAPLCALTGVLTAQPNGWAWCPHGTVGAWTIALTVVALAFVFACAGAIAGVALEVALRAGPWRDIPWLRYVKPALNWGGSTFAVLLVLYAMLAIASPLQPYGINEPYCWDEFCFRTTAVKRVNTIGEGAQQVKAHGTFYIVEATMEAPWWGRIWWSPDAVYVLTRDDQRYEHSAQGQRAIDMMSGRSSACHEVLGAAETETIVFDLPDDAVQPRLLVRDTLGFEGFMGAMRIGHGQVNPAFNLRYD
jgi:hypothetical protein